MKHDTHDAPSPRTTVGERPEPGTSERLAFWVFAAFLVIALPLLLWIGSYRWFFGDEWSFLTDRSVRLGDLFRDHNQHWVTLPVLVYRGMYALFGVRSYLPYQLLIVVLHLTLAALIRVVMRRAGVSPWVATIAAGAFVLLGAAEDNILWAFQIGFVSSLVLGITQVILVDHDGGLDRRDWFALAAGAASLMTTGQALALVAAAGLVCVIRRRWAAAALQTVPLGLSYLVWFVLSDVQPVVGIDSEPFTFGTYVRWMWDAATGVLLALGNLTPFAIALGLMLGLGVLTACRSMGAASFLRRNAVPVALVLAAIAAMTFAAPSRFFLGEHPARAGRYIGVMAALTLPILAVAADAIVRRWPGPGRAVLVLFLVPLPLNAAEFGDDPYLSPAYFDRQRAFVTALPDVVTANDVPVWVRPNDTILGQPDMTAGWLVGARDEGKLPPTTALDPATEAMVTLALGVATTDVAVPEGLTCTTVVGVRGADPRVGERWELRTPAQVALRSGLMASSGWLAVEPGVVEFTISGLQLLVRPAIGSEQFEVCR